MLIVLIKGSNATLHRAKKSIVNKVHSHERRSIAQMYKLNFPCLSLICQKIFKIKVSFHNRTSATCHAPIIMYNGPFLIVCIEFDSSFN
jgi:hypothetical protein